MSICPFVCYSVCLLVHLSICLFVHLYFCLFVFFYFCPFICLLFANLRLMDIEKKSTKLMHAAAVLSCFKCLSCLKLCQIVSYFAKLYQVFSVPNEHCSLKILDLVAV